MEFKRYFKRLLSVIILLNTTALFAQDLTNGLVSVWELDEVDGEVAVESFGHNDCSIHGAQPNQQGIVGKSYYFDGADYLKSSRNVGFSGNSPRSVSAWAKRTAENSDKFILYSGTWSSDNKYTFWYYSSLRVDFHGTSHNTSFVMPINEWVHIVATYDGSISRAYINGVPASTPSYTKVINTLNTPMEIGGEESRGRNWTGYIDQVAVWNRVLTESEISQLYNSGNGLPYTEWSGTTQLSGGTISPDTLTIDYNETPGTISSTASASGGSGSYNYQWQNSTDSGDNWSDISGATSSSYTPPALTQTSWFRRRVTDGTETAYSNNSAITVTIPGGGGTVTRVALASSDFSITGSPITSSGTITVNLANASVDAANLNNNVISGRMALTSGLSSTDELFVSDSGSLKRMDVSVLQNYLQSNLDFGSSSGTSLWSTSTTNNTNIVRESGNVGIGVSDPGDYKLAVNGTIRSKEVIVETNWADYVFEADYKLKSLEEIEKYIKDNGHLPDIPSAADVEENGVGLAEMNVLLLKKVEELTLHIINQQKEIEELKNVVNIKKEIK